MLTQMESFAGVFIASTNLMDGLDSAALRRFDLKVKLDYLRAPGLGAAAAPLRADWAGCAQRGTADAFEPPAPDHAW